MNTRSLRAAILLGAGVFAIGTLPKLSAAQENTQQQAVPSQPQQQDNTPAKRMHGRKLMEGLNLTEDQQAQMKKIREDVKAKAQALKADTSLSDTDKKAKFHELRVDAKKQMNAVLTPEQRQQLREKIKERRSQKQAPPQQS